MAWILEVTLKAVEVEQGFGQNAERPVGLLTFAPQGAKASTLTAAWADVCDEVEKRFLARLEPAKGDA